MVYTGWAKKTGPLCYIASNFGNTAQIYTIFCRNQSPFILNTKSRKSNLLKLIMYNSGAIWRIWVM